MEVTKDIGGCGGTRFRIASYFWISSNGGTIDKASNDKAEYYVKVKVRYYYDLAIYDNGKNVEEKHYFDFFQSFFHFQVCL